MFKFLKDKIKQITEKFKKKKTAEAEKIEIDVPENLEKEFDSEEYEAVIEQDKVQIEGPAEKPAGVAELPDTRKEEGKEIPETGSSASREAESHNQEENYLSASEETEARPEAEKESTEEAEPENSQGEPTPPEQPETQLKEDELEKEEKKAIVESMEKDKIPEQETQPLVEKEPAPEEEEIEKKVFHENVPEEEKEKILKPEKKGLFRKIIDTVVKKEITEKDLEDVITDLELGLIEADVSVEVAEKIINDIKESLVGKKAGKGEIEEIFIESLKKSMREILDIPHEPLEDEIRKSEKPYLIVLVGFNGVGKTTTAAKLGKYLLNRGFSVVLAAGDTFRAAAIEQLEMHGKSLGIDVVKKEYKHDSAAVIYDAVQHARKTKADVVIADTAGRNHEDQNLMDELKKIMRVNKPSKVLLVIDSITGNDAVVQAEKFSEIQVDGTILTKMDVNDKGGAALSVAYILKKPIYFVATGQGYDDMEEFTPDFFLERVFGKD